MRKRITTSVMVHPKGTRRIDKYTVTEVDGYYVCWGRGKPFDLIFYQTSGAIAAAVRLWLNQNGIRREW